MESIYNIAEICAQKNVSEFILSPGSRCAPLTISLVRHPEINTRTISDERSAAFIAIGISQQKNQTVGLVCTSGSAAYNYAPAVAEAFYQQIPLLLLTADRPPEWIDQLDGQTIRQHNIYGSHVKGSFTVPVDTLHPDAQWHIERIINEAINLTQEFPQGPVHVNIPLREPFYPEKEIVFNKNAKIIQRLKASSSLSESQWQNLTALFSQSSKTVIISGQQNFNEGINDTLEKLSLQLNVPIIGDIISNINSQKFINHHDIILSKSEESHYRELKPELLITFGKSVISKSLKTFLRKYKPTNHWHIQEAGYVADTYQSLTTIIPIEPAHFFKELITRIPRHSEDKKYFNHWKKINKDAQGALHLFMKEENSFTEFSACYSILQSLPSDSILHLANSMPVRYANYIGLVANQKNISVFANRGTSGIDGVISTAVGAALSTTKTVSVITGDMSFFYDRNAWWNNYIPSNLKIFILNNHGGGIFRMIEGPSRQKELEEYFETKQPLFAENTSKDFCLEYRLVKTEIQLKKELSDMFNPSGKAKIMEIETSSQLNTEIFKKFKKYINQ